MFCKKCGAEISDDAVFCGKCGTAQTEVATAQSQSAPYVQPVEAPKQTEEKKKSPGKNNVWYNLASISILIDFFLMMAGGQGVGLLWIALAIIFGVIGYVKSKKG